MRAKVIIIIVPPRSDETPSIETFVRDPVRFSSGRPLRVLSCGYHKATSYILQESWLVRRLKAAPDIVQV